MKTALLCLVLPALAGEEASAPRLAQLPVTVLPSAAPFRPTALEAPAGAAILREARHLTRIRIAVPSESLELPQQRCWTLRLATERGRAIRSAMEELKALQDRIRARVEGTSPVGASPELQRLVREFHHRLKVAVSRAWLLEGMNIPPFGGQGTLHLQSKIEWDDYRMARTPSSPGCASGGGR